MTYAETFKLSETWIKTHEVKELFRHFFGISNIAASDKRNDAVPEKSSDAFWRAVRLRNEGYPLQYILGSWTFMDCCFEIGEGVLIPRDDTEVCVRECMRLTDKFKMTSPVIIDLCSGSGAIAAALAKKYPKAHITAAELSASAYKYLERNIVINCVSSTVTPVMGDISKIYDNYEDGYFDIIISNPPYIKSSEIPDLQAEVQFEPEMALDGGSDGLDFYRIISEKWLKKLKKGGIISLEIGEDQGQAVSRMLSDNGIAEINIVQDIAGLDRTVSGIKNI